MSRLGRFAWKVSQRLEVILHIGAHRTGTTSLQAAIRKNQFNLKKNGLTFWGPEVTRGGIFSGLMRPPERQGEDETKKRVRRNRGAILLEMERLGRKKQTRLLISEENMMGAMRNNLRVHGLYPQLRRRLAPYARVFQDSISRVALAIRPYDDYWASAMAYAITVGHRAPMPEDLESLSVQHRTWRQVISDVADAFPKAEVSVWDFNGLIGRTASQFRILTGGQLVGGFRPYDDRHNAGANCRVLRQVFNDRGDSEAADRLAPEDGRFQPFNAGQIVEMRLQYANDLAWLRAGAESLARFYEKGEGLRLPATGFDKRGQL